MLCTAQSALCVNHDLYTPPEKRAREYSQQTQIPPERHIALDLRDHIHESRDGAQDRHDDGIIPF